VTLFISLKVGSYIHSWYLQMGLQWLICTSCGFGPCSQWTRYIWRFKSNSTGIQNGYSFNCGNYLCRDITL